MNDTNIEFQRDCHECGHLERENERLRAQLAAVTKERDEALKWKEEDPRMLREQIRVADVAYNHLHARCKELELANERANQMIGAQADENDRTCAQLRAERDELREAGDFVRRQLHQLARQTTGDAQIVSVNLEQRLLRSLSPTLARKEKV